MSTPARKQGRRSHGSAFGAPWGRSVKLATGASFMILATVIVVPQLALASKPAPLWVRGLVPALVVSVFGVIALFSVRGFTVQGRELRIQRLFWQTCVPLDDLKAAHVDAAAMKGAFRTAGNGGLFAFTGWFRSKKLGKFCAFVTDTSRCVVMEFKDRKIVVSPDDPEGFVKVLGFDFNSNPNQR